MEFFDIVNVKDKFFEQYIGKYELNSIITGIAERINHDYKNCSTHNPLIIIGVLNGSFMFLADLVKMLNIKCEIHFIKVSSYSGTKTTGKVREILGLTRDITNLNVLIVEDIVDTGLTVKELYHQLILKKPFTLDICTLLYKKVNCKVFDLNIKYVCKEIEDKFVIGYGLDYDNLGRNYDSIYSLIEDDVSMWNQKN
jgi:hypoxanthine phosphoribosyltransferase